MLVCSGRLVTVAPLEECSPGIPGDEVVAAYPKKRLEVILDNLNTHKKRTTNGSYAIRS